MLANVSHYISIWFHYISFLKIKLPSYFLSYHYDTAHRTRYKLQVLVGINLVFYFLFFLCFNILIDFLCAIQKDLEEWLGIEKLDFKP